MSRDVPSHIAGETQSVFCKWSFLMVGLFLHSHTHTHTYIIYNIYIYILIYYILIRACTVRDWEHQLRVHIIYMSRLCVRRMTQPVTAVWCENEVKWDELIRWAGLNVQKWCWRWTPTGEGTTTSTSRHYYYYSVYFLLLLLHWYW